MIFDAVGSARSDHPIGISRHLVCAEIAAGNERTASLLELPGLAAWVHSVPVGPVDAGGDVHYVSLCPSCIVSRIALADVSGHGQAVAALGEKLRELMERHLRELAQVGLMRELNQAVREELGDVHYATMVAVGWHSRRELLVMTNAGPPHLSGTVPRVGNGAGLKRDAPASEIGRPAFRSACSTTSTTTAQLSNCNWAILLCCTAMEPPRLRVRLEMNWVVTDSWASLVVSTLGRPKHSVLSSPQRSVPFEQAENLSTIKRSSC